MIIGVCGFIGCGKDTVADYLVNHYEFRRESFAGTLKDAVASVFGWDREMLEGKSKEARDWREEVDEWWAERLNMPTLTPRWVLQYWGTEVARKGFHNDIWIASLENKLRKSNDNIVISDCRFPNEVESIKRAGGKVVWVKRGELPNWVNTAKKANDGEMWAINAMTELGVHSSEWSWLNTDFDAVLENDSGLDDLYAEVRSVLEVSDKVALLP